MNIQDLSVSQLRRAAVIKEQIERLNKELGAILGAPARSSAAARKNGAMNVSTRKRIAVAQKARRAKLQKRKPANASARTARKSGNKENEPGCQKETFCKAKSLLGAKEVRRQVMRDMSPLPQDIN
jgi:hypothetical protein